MKSRRGRRRVRRTSPPPLPINARPTTASRPASIPVSAVVVVAVVSVEPVVSVVSVVSAAEVVVVDSEVLAVESASEVASEVVLAELVSSSSELEVLAGPKSELSIDCRIELSDDNELDDGSAASPPVARGITGCAPTACAVINAPPANSADASDSCVIRRIRREVVLPDLSEVCACIVIQPRLRESGCRDR